MNILFTLVAMYRTLVLQFTSAPHYVEETVKVKNGSVCFITGNGAGLTYTKSKEGKETAYNVRIQVPAGPGLRVPVSAEFADNEDRDAVSEVIKEAYGKLELSAENGIEIVIPKGSK